MHIIPFCDKNDCECQSTNKNSAIDSFTMRAAVKNIPNVKTIGEPKKNFRWWQFLAIHTLMENQKQCKSKLNEHPTFDNVGIK